MNEAESKPFCRRCLLKDFDSESYYENIYEYISLIPAEIKTPDEIYSKRLEICTACDFLINGMCGKCGCFVEVRAAKQTNSCPHERPRW